ncbi:DoxX family protein [Hyunsoonleella sp. SJ7]|uniref:DoxX family protein n=1 Tax=Hyunsoonleella aquatilis TaxID=2762758 RepID=A0A923HAM2_9FLAO|nr:DoxX family protein [Hyunsoonleella aquatilis]MBC3757466.1 DoxX family protein [Hyunsoonleella aquatilis]
MIREILKTNENWGQLIARLTLGFVLFPHGAQKMLGLFGGYGYTATMDALTNQMQLPSIIAFLVIIIEFFGAILLILGFATRVWSLAIVFLFIGIIFTAQFEHGFFMNWFGAQKGEGYEYSLLIIGLAITAVINGAGKLSVDNQILKYLNNK